jgi:hypothetical protein
MLLYLIYDENQELMRTVSRREEARAVVSGRAGWTFKQLRSKKKLVDLESFEEALF